eukprot:11560348-Alexandrium_andersonii.AAC.1
MEVGDGSACGPHRLQSAQALTYAVEGGGGLVKGGLDGLLRGPSRLEPRHDDAELRGQGGLEEGVRA